MVLPWTLGRYHNFLLGTAAWPFSRMSARRNPCGRFRYEAITSFYYLPERANHRELRAEISAQLQGFHDSPAFRLDCCGRR